MSASRRPPIFTVDQYLAYERASEERHEYLDGEIFGMAGESPYHADIAANASASLVVQLRGTPCRARIKDTKVRSGPTPTAGRNTTGLYSYPDIVVICGEPEYHDRLRDVVLNPSSIVEVLSPSTEAFDRGVKFTRYQTWNPSLKDYVLISQEEARIDHFHRQDDGTWTLRKYEGLDAIVAISSIGCSLKLADVYDRIDFSVE
jgi:Uma2 family endonuclease